MGLQHLSAASCLLPCAVSMCCAATWIARGVLHAGSILLLPFFLLERKSPANIQCSNVAHEQSPHCYGAALGRPPLLLTVLFSFLCCNICGLQWVFT